MPNLSAILAAIKIICLDVAVDAVTFAAYASVYNGMFMSYCLFQAAQKLCEAS